MVKKSTVFVFLTLILAACARSGAGVPVPAASAIPVTQTTSTPQTFSDPFAYCTAVGQIDKPDARYTGPIMSDALFRSYLKAANLNVNGDIPEDFKKMTTWRCMDHKVVACNFGANIPCDSKANTDKTPTQGMLDYCKQSPEVDFIPMSVTGHNVIYGWGCVKGQPQIMQQLDTVDTAGYPANFWVTLKPEP
jgi:hypothetical protein